MTYKEFFRKARRGRKWKMAEDGTIRCRNGYCPLAALTKIWDPGVAAEVLGLRPSAAERIAAAADSWGETRWLARNLGIKV